MKKGLFIALIACLLMSLTGCVTKKPSDSSPGSGASSPSSSTGSNTTKPTEPTQPEKKTKTAIAKQGTVTIDGTMEAAWDAVEYLEVKQVDKTILPSNTKVTGKVKMLWDDQYLYFFAEVTDETYHDTDSGKKGAEFVDSIDFQVDEKNDKVGGAGNMYANADKSKGVIRIGTNNSQFSGFGAKYDEYADQIKGICKQTDYGYLAEVAIPWSTITPQPNMQIGLDIQINDNSNGMTRTGQVTWNSELCNGWSDSADLGILILAS